MHSGHTKSCGCYQTYEVGVKSNCWKGYGEISRKLWSMIEKNAEKRNLKFNINIKYAWDLYQNQKGKCALTGIEIPILCHKKNSRGIRKSYSVASLDRIDSSKGYIKGNVWWVHKDINMMKHVYNLKQFVDYCEKVTKHCKKNNIGR